MCGFKQGHCKKIFEEGNANTWIFVIKVFATNPPSQPFLSWFHIFFDNGLLEGHTLFYSSDYSSLLFEITILQSYHIAIIGCLFLIKAAIWSVLHKKWPKNYWPMHMNRLQDMSFNIDISIQYELAANHST